MNFQQPEWLSIKIADDVELIPVSDVSEEYDYIEKNYPDAEKLGQALRKHGKTGKFMDVLYIKQKDGQIIPLCFDISSFFGM